MILLYFSYWGVNDGLTYSTVFPYLDEFSKITRISKIIFVTVERDKFSVPEFIINSKKCQHIAINSAGLNVNKFRKIFDVFFIKKKLLRIAKQNKIDRVFCKSAIAGAFGYFIYRKYNIPFYVDSFEPHADYMLSSKTWNMYGFKYYFQKRWEEKQMKYAEKLYTVSYNYFNYLKAEGVPVDKLDVVPVCVNTDAFMYNQTDRHEIRKKLNINDKIVGIYVGKYGGIYYDKEVFELYKSIFEYYKDNFYLIILTPDNKNNVSDKLKEINIPTENVYVDFVNHNEIPKYLSVADFAISTIRTTKYSKYCSPTKHGEYWAMGLPVIITKNISDDSGIIEKENIGYVLKELNDIEYTNAVVKIDNLLLTDRFVLQTKIRNIAKKYRSFVLAEKIYKEIYG